jgi:hypothetical protein
MALGMRATEMNPAEIINSCDLKFQKHGIDALTAKERVVVLASQVNFEVELGGLGAYFHNSAGSLSGEAVEALVELGAMAEAAALRKGRELLRNRSWEVLAASDAFEPLTDVFARATPDLFTRLSGFVEKHASELVHTPTSAWRRRVETHARLKLNRYMS